MQFQRTPSCCAAAALQNALRVFGVRVGQHKLARVIGVTDDGADEQDIQDALKKLGVKVEVFSSNRRADAITWLKTKAYHSPLILCVDDWGHWISVAGGCADRLWLYDPATAPWNVAENGSWPLLPKTIAKRWKAARRLRKEGSLYYGLALISCDTKKAKLAANTTPKDRDRSNAPILGSESEPDR